MKYRENVTVPIIDIGGLSAREFANLYVRSKELGIPALSDELQQRMGSWEVVEGAFPYGL